MKTTNWRVVGILTAAFCAAVSLIYFAAAAHADDAKASARTAPWKSEDVIFQEFAGQLRISPDAKWLVWVKSTADKEKDARVSNLFLTSLTESKEIQLTRGSRHQDLRVPDREIASTHL